ncbi:Helix-turn-helix domain-containing protein [Belnapia rosea]|nr:Helix-turn-helix domain-containing protein [Belnapia rosea]
MFENPVDSLHLYLPRTALDDLAEAAGAPKIAGLTTERDWENSDKTMRCLQPLLLDMLHASGTLASSFKEHVVLAAATHVAATYGGMRREPVRHGGLAPWQARRAKEMLEANLTKEVSLLDIAESCGLSLSHFSRAFKASTGHTPHSWLQRCRVERARELLRSPTIPFAEIAIACGFADQSHFTRTFKRATGSTPGHWRRISLC